MRKSLSVAVFLIAFLVWGALEFFVPGASEGLKDVLFWIGMLAVLMSGAEFRRARA